MNFTFTRLMDADLPLLHRWLSEPHVAAYWGGPYSLSDVVKKYGKDSVSKSTDLMIVSLNGTKIGFIQSYRASRVGGGWWPKADDSVVGIDQFIGEIDYVGKGYGSGFIRQYTEQLFADASVNIVIADPAPSNARAIRAYEKAGFRRAGEIETPDGKAMLMEFRKLY